MKKIDRAAALTWLAENTSRYPNSLGTEFAKYFAVSRAGSANFLRTLVAQNFLVRAGGKTRPSYSLGENRFIQRIYALPGIDESLIWEKDFAPYLCLAPNVLNICQYGFTEMLNNANDHSEGDHVLVYVSQEKNKLWIAIADTGIGIFKKISDAMKLSDMRLALLTLSKGKFTTDSKRHSGEGIFFTSRIFDSFCINANDLHYTHVEIPQNKLLEAIGYPLEKLSRLEEQDKTSQSGTTILMQLDLPTTRELREIFDKYTSDVEEMNFDKTLIPVRLTRLGTENLVSRSQAKRLLQRIELFRYVELDFAEVTEIGQAFADEIFRVFALQHPAISLSVINANQAVSGMIKRAINLREKTT